MSQQATTIFELNIEALLPINVPLATRLFAMQENKRFEVFQGEDPADINILDKETKEIFYEYPVKDTMKKYDEFDNYKRYPFLYLYGIGNGQLIKLLLNNSARKRIVVIEPEIELIYIALNLINFTKELSELRLSIELSQEIDFVRGIHYMSHKEGQLYAKLYDLHVTLPYYRRQFADEILSVNSTMTKALEYVVTVHGNSVEDSLMGVERHFRNLPFMLSHPNLKDLRSQKNSDLAIVVSTGPSLTKQLPLLKEIQDYVTIISVDASFPVLAKNGIKPDIVTVLERVPETGKFFSETPAEAHKDVIFYCVSIADEAVINGIKDGTTILGMRSHGYTTVFELDDYGYLGEGLSAANLAHELSMVMGYERCVLIGQDLAFGDDGTSHADDHFYGINEENIKDTDPYTEKYGGNGKIRTTVYWKIFMSAFERVITRTEGVVTTINSTEGGARIPGAIEIPFATVIEEYVNKEKAKEQISVKFPTQEETHKNMLFAIKIVNIFLREGKLWQEQAEEVFLEVQKETDNLIKLNKEKNLEAIDFDYIDKLIEKIDTIKEFFDDPDFELMYYNTVQSYILHQELDLAKLYVSNPIEDIDKKVKKVDWVLQHRYWLFSLAGGINAAREIIGEGVSSWPQKYKKELKLELLPEKKSQEPTQE